MEDKEASRLMFRCPSCGKIFRSLRSMKLHYKNKHIDEVFNICPVCGRSFYEKQRLKMHLAWMSRREEDIEHKIFYYLIVGGKNRYYRSVAMARDSILRIAEGGVNDDVRR